MKPRRRVKQFRTGLRATQSAAMLAAAQGAAMLAATQSAAMLAAAQGAAILAAALGATGIAKATPPIDATNWGDFTAPVFGMPETSVGGIYSAADLFAGPNNGRFADGNYYHGVIPDGKIVNPAGISIQIGTNPLGAALTPDGKYLIVSNDDEREGIGYNYSTPGGTALPTPSLQSNTVVGGYSLAVVNTATMKVVSFYQTSSDRFWMGLQVTGNGATGYTVYASGGADETVKVFSVTPAGAITKSATITPPALTPNAAGYVSNYKNGLTATTPVGSQYSRGGATITFPTGSALSRNGRYLYVALNTDNSVIVVDTTTNTVVQQIKVGYFPYAINVSADGSKVTVSNWGIAEYKFLPGFAYTNGALTTLPTIGPVVPPAGQPGSLFYTPTHVPGKSSSVMVFSANENAATNGNSPLSANPVISFDEGKALDNLYQVGDTHPSATAIVKRGGVEVLYVAKANSDKLGVIALNNFRALPDLDLSPVNLTLGDGHQVHGAYPNALVASADGTRLYVAEAGTNTVAVIDTSSPTQPKLYGRYSTGWYPTALALDAQNNLYVLNAKGVGEDINPFTNNGNPAHANPTATGVQSEQDSNYIFGSLQKINTNAIAPLDLNSALANSVAYHPATDTAVAPAGTVQGGSQKIKHVIFILHENKTFDSMLGNRQDHYGAFASTAFNYIGGSPGSAFAVKLFGNYTPAGNAPGSNTFDIEGATFTSPQYTGLDPNTQLLATTFASAVNYYSNSEESDAGHQYSASGTASDYTEKTLLTKTGRGMFANKNFEPEDYPEGGYIFNNAARNGVSFKDYGALIRVQGTDTGADGNVTVTGLPLAQAQSFVKLDDPTGTAVTGVPQLNITVNNTPVSAYTFPDPVSGRDNIPGINVAAITGLSVAIGAAVGNPANQALAGVIVLDNTGRVVNSPALSAPAPNTPGTVVPGSDVSSPTQGLGQIYTQQQPILEILGESNADGEPHLDGNYPGYNFNISDQRRAKEFIKDFDRMLNNGTLPQYLYIYQPNDHTGTPAILGFNVDATGKVTTMINATGPQLVADGDTGLGMVVSHIMKSPIYYDPATDTGAAIFISYDDAQSTEDHIDQHRTPLIVVSPFAKVTQNGAIGNGYVAKRHYITASIVKTEELLLGLPPNNLGDLLATDLRDMFQDSYNGITEAMLDSSFSQVARYKPTPAGRKVWALAQKLDTTAPDRDSRRLGLLNLLSLKADDLYHAAVQKGHLQTKSYQAMQTKIYKAACNIIAGPAPRDSDD
jgi:YVTN family beta-propeller protein